MLSRLFGSRGDDAPVAAPAVPPETRVYAIGDIHGRADLLRALHRLIQRDAAGYERSRRVVVYLGDYVDRGLESRQVIEELLEHPLEGFESVHLKGNHEEFMLHFLGDRTVGASWLFNGGNATIYSYGITMPDDAEADVRLQRLQADLAAALPPAHLDFLEGLALTHVEGDYLFVHAGVRPGVALDQQEAEDLMWIREPFLRSSAAHEKVVVHGHSISWEPEMRANRICIDTGAYASGKLTSLVLDGRDRKFLSTA